MQQAMLLLLRQNPPEFFQQSLAFSGSYILKKVKTQFRMRFRLYLADDCRLNAKVTSARMPSFIATDNVTLNVLVYAQKRAFLVSLCSDR